MPLDWPLNTWAIIFAVLGASSEVFGLVMVVRQIGADRDRARKLLDKQRKWRPAQPRAPRQVGASSISMRPAGIGSPQSGASERHLAGMLASLVNGHNQLVHDSEDALEQRTAKLLKELDKGDKELRDVLRELLGSSVLERLVGVVAIGVGIALAMVASILSTLG